MKNKNITTKWTILLSSTVLAACLLSACNNNNSNSNVNSSPSPTVSASPTPSESPSAEAKQGKGVFVGLADSHTVEITVDGEAAAYQLGEGTDSAVAALKEGDNVSFEYTEAAIEGDATAKLLTITKIEKAAGDTPAVNELPATKDFKFQLEGNEETRTGTLAKGDGYALYIFEQFKFDAAANKLIMNVDNDYYIEISKLPEGFKLDDVKADAEKELKSVGDVQSIDQKDSKSMIGDVDLMLKAASNKLTKEVIVKTVDGTSFLFKVNQPVGEPTEGFGPLAFTSMGSIAAQ
ncbi:hypothetical protein [Paenibacillus sp. JDR-2]|uniref:hypothetical protein n=1 Tax=Paenibacillus sp. (strain JDR-2) TaxID=324057 RepID=UPI000166B1FD|nr:hypothetical protein [Paenibacillus sp. JDR-2]ACS98946.1 hypothetical protein Pjdr2_0266 [Paenibacillus sp. JDR-2]